MFIYLVGFIFNIVSLTTSLSLPPHESEYNTFQYSRGLWFQTPDPIWISGIQAPVEINGDQVAEILYISGVPSTYPDDTKVVSLFKSVQPGNSGNNFLCVEPPLYISSGSFIGLIAGRLQADGSVSYSYGTASQWPARILDNDATLKRLQLQSFFIEEESRNGSTTSDKIARVNIQYHRDNPGISPFCLEPPPNPDIPIPIPTNTSTNGTTGEIPDESSSASILEMIF